MSEPRWEPTDGERVVHTTLLSRGTVVARIARASVNAHWNTVSVRWDAEPSAVMIHPIHVLRPLDVVERISELPNEV